MFDSEKSGQVVRGLLRGFFLVALSLVDDAQARDEHSAAPLRPRLLVLTDIGGDPDDQQSLIRLMLYSNEFEIEGLIASSAGTLGELKDHVTKPELIRQIVEAYDQVRPRLSMHAEGYPEAADLLGRIKSGNPLRGREVIGAEHDTEGSRWIIECIDRAAAVNDSRPLCISIWGGQTDLAQALWRVKNDRGAAGLRDFTSRLRVYDINDQDRIGDWMRTEFPGMFYVLADAEKGKDKREGAYRGMYLGGDESLTSLEWLQAHCVRNHGPLGALYPLRTWTAPNRHSAMKEGDTPSWFFYLSNGLQDSSHPDWGGWGGRFAARGEGLFRDAQDAVGQAVDARCTVWRWRPDYQADFQARLDWCVVERREDANHRPFAVLDGDRTNRVRLQAASAGETVKWSAEGSHDPDGHVVRYRWWCYAEPSSGRLVELRGAEQPQVELTIPAEAAGGVLHLILEVRDAGTPSLVSYRRAVITVAR